MAGVLRALPDVALFVFDADLRFVFCEGSSLRDRGHDPADYVGMTLREVLDRGVDLLEPVYLRALAGETLEYEDAWHGRRYSVRAGPLRDPDGTIVGGSVLSVDVSDRCDVDQARAEALERLDRIASNVPGVVYQVRVDADGSFSYPYVSEGIRDVVGIEPSALQNDPSLLLRLIHPDDLLAFTETMAEAWRDDTPSHWEGRLRLGDGSLRWLRISSRPQATDGGARVRDGVAIDVTEQRVAEETARWRLEHDALTGLPTRSLFMDRLTLALSQAAEHATEVAVCFIDIDRFARVNDALGRAVGDEVLCAIAQRIAAALRPADLLARLGGDELAVLLADLPERADAYALAERVASACRTPVRVGDRAVAFSCSIGVAMAPELDRSSEQLVRFAETAMWSAKHAGRARVEVFSPALERQHVERLWLEQHLRRAIERDELHLVYQPQIDAAGRCSSVEALVRWHPADREPVPPNVFIPVAEEIGLIGEIGAWVLRASCAAASQWKRDDAALRICVNLSPGQLADPEIASFVARTLDETGLPASLLELELTETALIEQGERAVVTLSELRALGVRISLDDFGTGYSSLARLRNLPLDALKIDASFVAEIGEARGTPILRGIVGLGHTLGLEVIAEGVETREQERVLIGLGCDRLQGYLLGRPERSLPARLRACASRGPAAERRTLVRTRRRSDA